MENGLKMTDNLKHVINVGGGGRNREKDAGLSVKIHESIPLMRSVCY